MRESARPTYKQVRAFPSVVDGRVEADHTDGNGHMNVRHIYAMGVTGADLLSEQLGIDDDYRNSRRMGTFAAEHHVRFFAEIREGDDFSVHPVWIDRSERAGHVLVFVLNQTDQMLSSILELIVVNVDLDSRSPVAFPPDVVSAMDLAGARTRSVGWRMPVSGTIGVRA